MAKTSKTMDLHGIVADAQQQQREAARATWQRYRELLEMSANGGISAPDAAELGEIVLRLKLTVAEVESHADSLRRHAAAVAKRERLPDLRAELSRVNEGLAEWFGRRAAAIAKLDAEGNPMLCRARELEVEAWGIESTTSDIDEREPGKFPELFGRGFDPPKPPPLPLTDREREENTRLAAAWSGFCAVRVALKAGRNRETLDDESNDEITIVIAASAGDDGNPRRYRPDGGWPNFVAEGYPASMMEDPRKRQAIARAREKARNKILFDDMSDDGRRLLSVGVRFGWLNHDWSVAAENEQTGVDSDQEAEVASV